MDTEANKLTEQDKQRIEDFITKLGWDEKGTAEFNDMMKVAEYATRYQREQQAELLTKYSEFLENHGYIDSDWRDEKPSPIDEFFKPK